MRSDLPWGPKGLAFTPIAESPKRMETAHPRSCIQTTGSLVGWRTFQKVVASQMDPTRPIEILRRLQVRGAVALGAVLAAAGLARLIHADVTLPVLVAAVGAALVWLRPLYCQLRDRYVSLSSDEEKVREVLGDMVSAVAEPIEDS